MVSLHDPNKQNTCLEPSSGSPSWYDGWLVGFSSITRLYRGRAPRQSVWQFNELPACHTWDRAGRPWLLSHPVTLYRHLIWRMSVLLAIPYTLNKLLNSHNFLSDISFRSYPLHRHKPQTQARQAVRRIVRLGLNNTEFLTASFLKIAHFSSDRRNPMFASP